MFGLQHREALPPFVADEFENLNKGLSAFLLAEHNEDGTHITTLANLNFVPVGLGPLPWPAATAPSGWLLCRGQQVSRVTYKGLFDVIGTTYGAGDGSTTFNVPDVQQRFLLGKAAAGTGSVLGGTGGAIDHSHTAGASTTDAGGDHSHGGATGNESSHTHGLGTLALSDPSNVAFVDNDLVASTRLMATDSHNHSFTGALDAGSSHSHTISASGTHTHGMSGFTTSTNNPPFLTVNFIIFTGVA